MKAFRIIWSDFAERQLDGIYDYYFLRASPKVAKNLVKSILRAPNKLKQNRYLGPIEESLRESGEDYRYIVHRNFKIIYFVDDQHLSIRILDVFDCRLDPDKIGRNK